ncbi:universal stress protein [Erythrobacter sp. SAORIC-644]|nr:universal stress protein [Erythrobacter sp. SAORIC-644]PNQ74144.1 universal stress protein [Erythrobacter sp. SAORIC-644]
MPGKIVVGTDFRAEADRAIDRALELAKEWNTEVVLVHALDPALGDPPTRGELDKRMRSVLPDSDIKVTFRYPIERADYAIASVAKEEGASLIVLGAARFNSMKDFLLGTAVDYVIRHSPVPVLVVKTRATARYRRIACATDFYTPSRVALEKTAELFPKADFQLIHAYHVPFEGWQKAEYVKKDVEKAERKVFDEFLEEIDPETRKRVTTHLVYGSPGGALRKDIRESETDLLVLGTHGESALRHASIGSTANELLRSLPIDTLVVTHSAEHA